MEEIMIRAMQIFREFETHALRAYELLKAEDRSGYSRFIQKADKVAAKASKLLNPCELETFRMAADRTYDVLKKCTALGLTNLEKRLREFRISEMVGGGACPQNM